MKSKLALIILYSIAVMAPDALLARQTGSQRDC
jgi:hypothetical protein